MAFMLGQILRIQQSYMVFYQLRMCVGISGFKVNLSEGSALGF